MNDLTKLATGAIITLIIGGTAYSFNQADVVKNFAEDTGLTQQQAEQYISGISEDELASFDELGADEISLGQGLLSSASKIDCVNYEYEWESGTLSCSEGKAQINKIARDSISLGQAYIKLVSDSASKNDISATIGLIDQQNDSLESQILISLIDRATIDEMKQTNSYNKALLKAALESGE